MGFTTQTIRAATGQHRVMLDVSLTSTAVCVAAGEVIAEGVAHALRDAQSYTLMSRAHRTRVTGYLALNEADQTLALLVDEFVEDGQDTPFRFAGSGYRALHMLFDMVVPPSVTDPEACVGTVWLVDDTFEPADAAMRARSPAPSVPAPLAPDALLAALREQMKNLPRS